MLKIQKSKKVSPAFICIVLFCVLIAGSAFYFRHRFLDSELVERRCAQQVDKLSSVAGFGGGVHDGDSYTGFFKEYYDNCVKNGGEVEDGKFLID